MDDREIRLLDCVRALALHEFAQPAAASDRAGRMACQNLDALRVLGIPAISLPASIGGLGLSAEAQMRLMEAIAYGDGSTAVALNMHRIAVDALAALPDYPHGAAVLADVARNGALLCLPGSVPVDGLDSRRSGYRAREQADGFAIDGAAGFASISDAATYALIAAVCERPGVGVAGQPVLDLVMAAPRVDSPGLTIVPTWDAMGLRGTASNTVVCDGLVVPRDQVFVAPLSLVRALVRAVHSQGGREFQRRGLGTLGILAIWLGLSQAAFDFTVEYVKQRHGYLAGTTSALGPPPGYRAEQPWAQIAIGNMDHWLGTGRAIFYDTVRRVDERWPSGGAFTRRLARTVYHLRRMSEEVAMGAMKVCGAHAYVKERPLERIFRDLIGGVVMAWKTDELVQSLGRAALGLSSSVTGPAGS